MRYLIFDFVCPVSSIYSSNCPVVVAVNSADSIPLRMVSNMEILARSVVQLVSTWSILVYIVGPGIYTKLRIKFNIVIFNIREVGVV